MIRRVLTILFIVPALYGCGMTDSNVNVGDIPEIEIKHSRDGEKSETTIDVNKQGDREDEGAAKPEDNKE